MAFTFSPSTLDLTDLALVKGYENCPAPGDTSKDNVLQMLITSASVEFLRLTGHVRDGIDPATSPFVSPQSYDEWYDGTGTETLYLRSWPVRTVTLVQAGGTPINQSTDWNVQGWAIDQDKRALVMRSMGNGPYQSVMKRYRGLANIFPAGVQNIHIISTRGFDKVPVDVTRAVSQIVAANVNRAPSEGLASQSFSVSGRSASVSFKDWVIPPQAQKIIDFYMCAVI